MWGTMVQVLVSCLFIAAISCYFWRHLSQIWLINWYSYLEPRCPFSLPGILLLSFHMKNAFFPNSLVLFLESDVHSWHYMLCGKELNLNLFSCISRMDISIGGTLIADQACLHHLERHCVPRFQLLPGWNLMESALLHLLLLGHLQK